jgi:hypothetical protein
MIGRAVLIAFAMVGLFILVVIIFITWTIGTIGWNNPKGLSFSKWLSVRAKRIGLPPPPPRRVDIPKMPEKDKQYFDDLYKHIPPAP